MFKPNSPSVPGAVPMGSRAYKRRLDKAFGAYALGLVLFVLALGALEQMGMPRRAIGVSFLLATVAVYACIGMACRTTAPVEYYVAGRRVPAMYNGMATAADWMSAASFIGLAGTLFLGGYDGLAFILGWTGGYCLVALFLALRPTDEQHIPDVWSRTSGVRRTADRRPLAAYSGTRP